MKKTTEQTTKKQREQDAAEYLQTFPTEIIAAVVRGEINLLDLAKIELVSRGCGLDGKWVGFDRALDEVPAPGIEEIEPTQTEPRAYLERQEIELLRAVVDRLKRDHDIDAGLDDVVGSIVIAKDADRSWWFGTANGREWNGDLVKSSGVVELTAVRTGVDAREINALIIADGIERALSMWARAIR